MLASLARRALTALPLAALLQEAALGVAQELAVPLVAVWQPLPGGHALRLSAGIGWPAGAIGAALVDADDRVPEWATLSGPAALDCADLRRAPHLIPLSLVREARAVSAALVAIPGDDHPVGILAIYDRQPREFAPSTIAYLREVAAILGAAQRRHLAADALRQATGDLEQLLQRATSHQHTAPADTAPAGLPQPAPISFAPAEYPTRSSLRDELRSSRLRAYESMEQRLADRTRQLTAIYAITAKASAPLALEELLTQVLALVLDVAGATAGGVQIFDDPQAPPHHAAAQGLPDGALAHPLGGTAAGDWLLAHDAALLVRDTAVDPRTAPLAWLPRGQSCALVPIHARGHIRGVLAVVRAWVRPFTEDEAALLAAIGDQLGVATEHARLFAEVQDRATRELRLALSRDLHDSLTQSLYSLTLLTEVTTRQLRLGDPALVEEYLTQLGTTARQAMKEMRLLIYDLRSATLAEESLADALERRLDAVERRAGVAARLKVETVGELSVAARTELFQIAQEALNNVLKHAAASQVAVELRERDGQLELLIADDGRGFDPGRLRDRGGLGLASMRERAAGLGGVATFAPSALGGTQVAVRVPLARTGRESAADLVWAR